MRIWDQIPPEVLCRNHLLGEHRELHGLWNILVRIEDEGAAPEAVGYARHPESLRWLGRRPALYRRHAELVREMTRRGYRHKSPLNPDEPGPGSPRRPAPLDDQREALRAKGCGCGAGRSTRV